MKKHRLFTPGPTMVPEDILLEMARPQDHHRTADFRQQFKEVTDHLQYLFQTQATCLTLTGSGTLAGESAIVSCCPPKNGHKVLCCRGGKFGERWAEICQAFDIPFVNYDIEWGRGANPEEIDRLLTEDSDLDTVTLVHSETCSSSVSDVQAIAQVTRKHGALLIVDGITAVGTIPVKMDEWGLDVCFTGSQKALMLPPGLAFVAVSDQAWQRIETGDASSYYANLKKYRKSLEGSDTPFTPNNQLIRGLARVLRDIKARGLESIWAQTALMARATRSAALAMGLKVFAADPVDSVTGLVVPDGVDEGKLRKMMRSRFGMRVAGGQGHIKGKVIRISHMGYCDVFDTLGVISAVELALLDQGFALAPGQGVAAAQKAFAEGVEALQ
ncbi:MAG: pyridoxal-phosphate-dependent aminotransferase family protein [Phycisphaerae bacterium]